MSRLLLVFVVQVLYHVQAVVHEPRNYKLGLVEPVIIEAELQYNDYNMEKLFTEATRQRSLRRDVPQSTPPLFGTTSTLHDDHHTYGLVHWSGLPKERIFILTRKRKNNYSVESFLWISKDYGKTFEQITHLLPNDSVAEWYYISSNADKLVFTDRINKRLYVTVDEGDSFTSINISFVPDRIVFQKTWVPNVSQYEDHILGYDQTNQELWLSTNTGLNWAKLSGNVTRYAWRELNETYEDPGTVYFDKKINANSSLLYKATNQTSYQPQLFDSALGPFMPGTFTLSHQYMFVQKNYTVLGIDNGLSPLWISHLRAPFKPAGFPLNLEEKHYALVDASENQVLMAVYHDPNNTHVYISEEAGMNYTLSLSNIISPPESEWIDSYPTFDVYVVESLVGTYIANRIIPTSKHGATVISFDKGGEWIPVIPPSVDRDGKPISCNAPCSLHLHMFVDSSYFIQPILSQDSAPGIIMAIGNIGTNIVNNKNKLRLYMSDNGGVTWRELFTGYKQFQLLDYGVFTVVVEKYYTTFYTQISCDEGYNWQNYTFTNYTDQVRVVALFTERGEASQHATIFAYHPGATSSTFEWLVIDLNFTTLNLSQCGKDDYYLWKPTDERPDQDCILGESIEYERRLPDRCCYIDIIYDRPINRTSCKCTKEDFECEIDFERVGLDGPCQAVDGYLYPPNPPNNCPEQAKYSYISGYRKIAGDKCVQGEDTFFLPIVQDCPLQAPTDIDLRTIDNVYSVLVEDTVNFKFTQGQGAVILTEYTWSYGDNTTSLFTGINKAATTSHTYLYPGSYEVQVKALNSGGQGIDDVFISVSDKLTSVSIISPASFLFVVTRPMNFYANVTSKYGTNIVYNTKYIWKIEGHSYTMDSEYFSYLFSSPGEYTLELTVSYIGGIVEDTVTLTVTDSTSSSTSKSYLPVAIGVGVIGLVVLIVAIAITIAAIYYYKRKYRSLEVRYSRLRQGPMRFTFSAEGENIEEEDDDDDDDDNEGGVVNDKSTLKAIN